MRPTRLFQPNDLSIPAPQFQPIDNDDLRRTVSALLSQDHQIDLGSSLQVERSITANVTSLNLRAVTGNSQFILKRRSDTSASRDLASEAEWSEFLAERRFPAPRVIRSAAGQLVTARDGSWWTVYWFEEGGHFTGALSELDSASRVFGWLTKIAQDRPEAEIVDTEHTLEEMADLPELLGAASSSQRDPRLSAACAEHGKYITDIQHQLLLRRESLETERAIVHTDFHPANLLVRDGTISCVLDLENLEYYAVPAALGFSVFKLVRQMLVNSPDPACDLAAFQPVKRWLAGWRQSFPNSGFTPDDLAWGARYRVLSILRMILHNAIVHSDHRFVYDLEKQVLSLYEIDVVFASHVDRSNSQQGEHQ